MPAASLKARHTISEASLVQLCPCATKSLYAGLVADIKLGLTDDGGGGFAKILKSVMKESLTFVDHSEAPIFNICTFERCWGKVRCKHHCNNARGHFRRKNREEKVDEDDELHFCFEFE